MGKYNTTPSRSVASALAFLCIAQLAATVVCVSAVPDHSSARSEASRLYDALSKLTFKNLGVIDKDLKLYNKLQCALYREKEVTSHLLEPFLQQSPKSYLFILFSCLP